MPLLSRKCSYVACWFLFLCLLLYCYLADILLCNLHALSQKHARSHMTYKFVTHSNPKPPTFGRLHGTLIIYVCYVEIWRVDLHIPITLYCFLSYDDFVVLNKGVGSWREQPSGLRTENLQASCHSNHDSILPIRRVFDFSRYSRTCTTRALQASSRFPHRLIR